MSFLQRCFIGVALLLTCNLSICFAENYHEQAIKLLESKSSKLVYSDIVKIATESIAWVRNIYTPAEIILFGGFDMSMDMLKSGLKGAAEYVTKQAVLSALKYINNHPSSAAKQIAKQTFEIGLKAYRCNYRIYKDYKRNNRISEAEAFAFVINNQLIELMEISKDLMNDISQYERGEGKYLGQDRAKLNKAMKETETLLTSLPESKFEKAFIFTKVWKICEESDVGLTAYPPYRTFLNKVREVQNNIKQVTVKEDHKLSAKVTPKPPTGFRFFIDKESVSLVENLKNACLRAAKNHPYLSNSDRDRVLESLHAVVERGEKAEGAIRQALDESKRKYKNPCGKAGSLEPAHCLFKGYLELALERIFRKN